MKHAPVTRRVVLGAAAVGGFAVAADRLLGLGKVRPAPPEAPAAPSAGRAAVAGLDWSSPLAQERARVAHLLRRTSLGYTAAELDAAASDGYARTVDRLLETPPAEPPDLPRAEEASAASPLRIADLRKWWVDWAFRTPTPFAERMTLFWHGLFTTDFRKVGLQSPFLYWQDRTWRRFFVGDLRTILYEMTIDPAMLRYLDLGQSSGADPNENFSRELMELFTLGTGAYTEDDVKAGAKALAGWRGPRTAAMIAAAEQKAKLQGGAPPRRAVAPDGVRTGIFEPRRAYRGAPVRFLGATRAWDTRAVLERILEQEAAAPHVVRRVLAEFVTPAPDDAMVRRLADRFRAGRYDMRSLMADVLRSPEFANGSYRSLVRSPAEYALATMKALEAPELAGAVLQYGPAMGEALFDPPSVGGWPRNADWISSNTILARVDFAVSAAAAARRLPPAGDAHALFLDATVGPATASLLGSSMSDRDRWAVLLSSPEFQLK